MTTLPTDNAETFRAALRRWIVAHLPTGPDHEWESALVAEGLVCPQWPHAYGGHGLTDALTAVLDEEFHRAGVRRVTRGIGESAVGPTLLRFGTAEQRESFLPRIVTGKDVYCLGFSEPEYGSDLANVRTNATIDGDDLVVTGCKTWIAHAQEATMMLLLCRTDPDAPAHDGITLVLLPMLDNNVAVRPIRQLTGECRFSAVILDRARVPVTHVLGGMNNGWPVARTVLLDARAAFDIQAYEAQFWDLVDHARKAHRIDEDILRHRLAAAYVDLRLVRLAGSGPMATVLRAEALRRLGELAIDIEGRDGLIRPEGAGYPLDTWQEAFLTSRAETISTGTSEIQRDIIAERVLGLPS